MVGLGRGRFRCIKGHYHTILASTRCLNDQANCPSIYRRRRYITYRLSYRDLAAMMAERGIIVSHTTILRWVIRYVPEFEKRWNRFARPLNTS
jgi:hypothetical protein